MNDKQLVKTLKSNMGFTLIEMMIVISVMALIMGIVGSNIYGRFNRAKIESTQLQMKQLGVVLDDFRRDCGFYPTTEQSLEALIQKPGGRECKNYDPESYIRDKKLPKDGFGNPFNYTSNGNTYVITSLGNDGKEGGEGLDKDIASDQID